MIGCGGLLAKMASTEASTYVVYIAVDDLRMRNDGGSASYREQVDEINAVSRRLGFSWEILFDNEGLTNKLDTVDTSGNSQILPKASPRHKQEPFSYNGLKDAAFAEGMAIRVSGDVPVPLRELIELFEAMLHDYRPELLLLPTAGPDEEGRRICEAGLAAARAGARRTGHWVVPQVMGYEQTALRAAFGTAPGFTAFIDISEQITVKLEALTLYKTKATPPPGIRSVEGVRALARLRGAQIDVPYAEALHVFRAIL